VLCKHADIACFVQSQPPRTTMRLDNVFGGVSALRPFCRCYLKMPCGWLGVIRAQHGRSDWKLSGSWTSRYVLPSGTGVGEGEGKLYEGNLGFGHSPLTLPICRNWACCLASISVSPATLSLVSHLFHHTFSSDSLPCVTLTSPYLRLCLLTYPAAGQAPPMAMPRMRGCGWREGPQRAP
jgi:hypothetical protein